MSVTERERAAAAAVRLVLGLPLACDGGRGGARRALPARVPAGVRAHAGRGGRLGGAGGGQDGVLQLLLLTGHVCGGERGSDGSGSGSRAEQTSA